MIAYCFPVLLVLAVGAMAAVPVHADEDILGQGRLRFTVVPGWGAVGKDIQLHDCHAMRMDRKGQLVLINNGPKNNIIIYNKAGKVVESWGTAYPGVHGLNIVEEKVDGKDTEFLWLTDHDRHQVIKVTMDGKEVKIIDWPQGTPPYTAKEQFKPTDVEIGKNGDLYVCDGYGQSMMLHYDATGKLLRAWGGRGSKPENLDTPHGCMIDRRDPAHPLLIVASRGQQTLKRFTLDGDYVDAIPMPGADVCDSYVHGTDLYVPNLNGYVSILDKDFKVVSNVGGSPPVYDANGILQKMSQVGNTFIHPHNLYVDAEGSIYVVQWNSNGTHPIKLVHVKN